MQSNSRDGQTGILKDSEEILKTLPVISDYTIQICRNEARGIVVDIRLDNAEVLRLNWLASDMLECWYDSREYYSDGLRYQDSFESHL